MVFAFNRTILLMSVGAGDLVGDAKLAEVGVEVFILSTLVWLNIDDLLIKEAFNKVLKFNGIFEDIRLMTQQINLGKFTVIINKWDIVFLTTKRFKSRPAHIRKNEL
jgi:hypothetical protein